jgi:hypothetical protein
MVYNCILFHELGFGWHCRRSIALQLSVLTGALQCFGSSGSQPVFVVTGSLWPINLRSMNAAAAVQGANGHVSANLSVN